MSHYYTTPFAQHDQPHRQYRDRSHFVSRTPRVLVVDNDEETATGLAMILSSSGFDAVAAFEGTSARRLASVQHFDILVTEILTLPIDGVRIATGFRNINPASHIFLLTETYEIAQQLLTDANLAWDFRILLKPIDPAQVIKALRSAWNHEAMLSQ